MKKYGWTLILLSFVLSACSSGQDAPAENQKVNVVAGASGDYSIMTPFEKSELRSEYGAYFREIDMVEIGRELQENAKEHFSPNNYYISEGSLINRDRYLELMSRESDDTPYGLNPKRDSEVEVEGKKLTNPLFISDLVAIDFHKSTNLAQIDGVAVALVLKRVQLLDANTGAMTRLNDETLYQVGETIGLRLQSYLRTLDGMVDIPILMGLYVQESDVDSLPGKYLPGYYIGTSYSETSSSQFVPATKKWLYLTQNDAKEAVPQVTSAFSIFKNKVADFISDENVGVVGKVFVDKNVVHELQLEVTTGATTYLELYGLTQYISDNLRDFGEAPVVVNVKINQSTRFVIHKNGNDKPVITALE